MTFSTVKIVKGVGSIRVIKTLTFLFTEGHISKEQYIERMKGILAE